MFRLKFCVVSTGHLYIHIPYCKKLCYYCDFHFSLNLKTKKDLVLALCKELYLRKDEQSSCLATLYFGGGTPSLLNGEELSLIFQSIHSHFSLLPECEISFECNPDDITENYCHTLKNFGVNRLSIGIQSFFDEDLQLLNRRHSAQTARQAVKIAQDSGFSNITIDLIYGLPNMTMDRWKYNLNETEKLNIQHLSAYALMVEEHTALHKFVKTGKIIPANDEDTIAQYNYLIDWAQEHGFNHYEISNFAKNGLFSHHNYSYWTGEPYLGIGPSAHSFDGKTRKWNCAHNAKYIESLRNDIIPLKEEILSDNEKFNELIMTRLRTKSGVDIRLIKNNFSERYYRTFVEQTKQFIRQGLLCKKADTISLTRNGIMISDTIISDLFIVD